ncbi:MAG: alpha/beta hydrolase [Chroococcidiopsidaceae cyanobacterium CP_BM_RX_35]|nr:alpha/beta hydrolase [Chroococcidiopsidaceae cyanobacterium CP_BM_RX_35]
MVLAPDVRGLLDKLEKLHPPVITLPVEEARQIREVVYSQLWGEREAVANVEDHLIPGPAGQLQVRVYRPASRNPLPVLVYFHGGGWVTCSIDSYDGLCRAFANGVNCIVVSVNYRLAPEHKFPAAVEDAYAATAWVANHASEIGGDPTRIAIGGDSCGGNLTAVVALMARERKTPRLGFQMLLYPCTDYEFERPSALENAFGYYLTLDAMRWFWKHYLNSEVEATHPYASPLRAEDLRGLPSALFVTAQFDPLRDQGEAYAKRLREAKVPVTYKCYDGMIHCFLSFAKELEQARAGLLEVIAALQSAFANCEPSSP